MSDGTASKTLTSSRWMSKGAFVASWASSVLYIVGANWFVSCSFILSFSCSFLLLRLALFGSLAHCGICCMMSLSSLSPPHHPPAHGPSALSPASPLSAKEFGLCNCSSPGLCENLRDLSCKSIVGADQRRDQSLQGRKEFQRLRVSP